MFDKAGLTTRILAGDSINDAFYYFQVPFAEREAFRIEWNRITAEVQNALFEAVQFGDYINTNVI